MNTNELEEWLGKIRNHGNPDMIDHTSTTGHTAVYRATERADIRLWKNGKLFSKVIVTYERIRDSSDLRELTNQIFELLPNSGNHDLSN